MPFDRQRLQMKYPKAHDHTKSIREQVCIEHMICKHVHRMYLLISVVYFNKHKLISKYAAFSVLLILQMLSPLCTLFHRIIACSSCFFF